MIHHRPAWLAPIVAGLLLVGCAGATPTTDGAGPTATGSASTAADTRLAPAPTAGTWTGTVDHVSDGDTLWLVVVDPGPTTHPAGDEVTVRLLRIDTPELGRDGQAAECLAEAARDHLRTLLPEGTPVTAAHDTEERDRYGRDLAHLWRDDGLWVNGSMLRDGFATVVTFPPNVAHDDAVHRLEAAARADGAGLWSAC